MYVEYIFLFNIYIVHTIKTKVIIVSERVQEVDCWECVRLEFRCLVDHNPMARDSFDACYQFNFKRTEPTNQ